MTRQKWHRVEGWAVALAGVIEHHGALPFQYGVSDCGILAADAVKAVLGEDILKPYRGYRTKKGAGRILAKAGCLDVGELFARHFKECDKSAAMRGDIGVVEFTRGGHGQAVTENETVEICGGVFTGSGFACKGESGLVFADYDQITRAFFVSLSALCASTPHSQSLSGLTPSTPLEEVR